MQEDGHVGAGDQRHHHEQGELIVGTFWVILVFQKIHLVTSSHSTELFGDGTVFETQMCVFLIL